MARWRMGRAVRGRRGVDGEVEALVLLCLLSEEEKHLSCRKKHREGKVQEECPCEQGVGWKREAGFD